MCIKIQSQFNVYVFAFRLFCFQPNIFVVSVYVTQHSTPYVNPERCRSGFFFYFSSFFCRVLFPSASFLKYVVIHVSGSCRHNKLTLHTSHRKDYMLRLPPPPPSNVGANGDTSQRLNDCIVPDVHTTCNGLENGGRYRCLYYTFLENQYYMCSYCPCFFFCCTFCVACSVTAV